MKKFFRACTDFPAHPFFIASYFLARLYAANLAAGITLGRLIKPYWITLAAMTAAWLVLGLLLKGVRRSAVLVSAGAFIFFSAGYAHGALNKIIPLPAVAVMAVFAAAWLGLFVFVWLQRPEVRPWTPRLNAIAFLLFLMPFSQAVLYHAGKKPVIAPQAAQKEAALAPRQLTPLQMRMPDVYYIILDEYGHHDALQEVFHYDNSWFLEALKKMGFHFTEDSRCNYMLTVISMASALNMTYLDAVSKKEGPDSEETAIPFAMVRGNTVARMFKKIGYQYVMTDTGMSPMDNSPLADKVYSFTGTDEFSALLANVTMLKGSANDFILNQQRQRHVYNFKAMEQIPEIPGPVFAYLHLTMPHPPFVFDRDGKPSKARQIEFKPEDYWPEYEKYYIDQLIYTSKAALDLIQMILRKSEQTPIIILQSDHGLRPNEPWANTERFVRLRGRILNAYLVPPAMRENLYPTITPVNTFRLLFKTVFGAPVQLIEDRTYFAPEKKHLYAFEDVSDLLNKGSSSSAGSERQDKSVVNAASGAKA